MANLFQTSGASSGTTSASNEISNLGLATSVAGNALTIALKQSDGATDPGSGSSAVKVGMRSATATSGLYNQRSVTSALSLVVSSGSTLGQTSAKQARLFIYLIDNAGTLELAVSQSVFYENSLVTTTAEGGVGGADSGVIMYSATQRTGVPFRLIGFLDNTQATAGTWSSAGSQLQVGSYAVLADEKVFCRAYLSADQTGVNPNGSSVKINIDSTSTTGNGTDSHTCFSSSAFTAKISGRYLVYAQVAILATNVLATEHHVAIFKNGAIYSYGPTWNPASSTGFWANHCDAVNLLAGEYVEVYLFGNGNNSVSTLTADGSATGDRTFVNFERIGNF